MVVSWCFMAASAESTQVVTGLQRGSASAVANELADLIVARLGPWPTLALVFASGAQPLSELMPLLKGRLPATLLLGASSAGVLTEAGAGADAASVFAIRGDLRVAAAIGRLGAGPERAVAQLVSALPAHVEGYPHRTAILLLDPLSGRGEEVAELVAARLGPEVSMVGAAAADDRRMQETLVGCDADVSSDAAVLAVIHSRELLGVGVHQAESVTSDGMVVTRASGNVIHELNGRPAWEVWVAEVMPAALAARLDPNQRGDLGALFARFHASIASQSAGGKTLKIRAPLAKAVDGSMRFVSAIPEGTILRITESDVIRLDSGVRAAASRARASAGDLDVAGALVFDCVSHSLTLGERYPAVLRAISDELGGAPLAGFGGYGEISVDGKDAPGFQNLTTVVLTFPK